MSIRDDASVDPSTDLPPWLSFVVYWLRLDPSRFTSEDAVKGEVMPYFLSALGYGGTTLHEVLYGHPLPRLRISVGSKSKHIDYVPTYRLQRFWIIETKSPAVGLTKKAFEQAYYYAIHHTVRARYFVLADGISFRVYDVTAEDFDEPRVVVTRADAQTTFGELYELLAASKIKASIRAEVLSDVGRILVDEIDEAVPSRIVAEVKEVTDSALPQIRQNLFELRRESIAKWNTSRTALLSQIETRGLIANAALPTEMFRELSNELARRIVEAVKTTGKIPWEVERACKGVQTSTERFNVGRALLVAGRDLREDNLRTTAIAYARDSLAYCPDDAKKRAALLLERALLPVVMKLTKLALAESSEIMTELARRGAAYEDLIRNPPSAIAPVVLLAGGQFMRLWREWSVLNEDEMNRITRTIVRFERDRLDVIEIPRVESDSHAVEMRGPAFDFLLAATAEALAGVDEVDPTYLPSDLKIWADRWNHESTARSGGHSRRPWHCESAIVPEGDIDEELLRQFVGSLEQTIRARDASLQALTNLAEWFRARKAAVDPEHR